MIWSDWAVVSDFRSFYRSTEEIVFNEAALLLIYDFCSDLLGQLSKLSKHNAL